MPWVLYDDYSLLRGFFLRTMLAVRSEPFFEVCQSRNHPSPAGPKTLPEHPLGNLPALRPRNAGAASAAYEGEPVDAGATSRLSVVWHWHRDSISAQSGA